MVDTHTRAHADSTATRTRARTRALAAALCLMVTLVSLPSALQAEIDAGWLLTEPLTPFTASYRVGNNAVHAGNARVELRQQSPGEWVYSLTTRPMGLFKLAGKGYVAESATLSVVDQNNALTLLPKSYRFRQDNENRRAIDATFNWPQKQLYFSHGTDNAQIALGAETVDRMTMTLALMSTLTPDFQSYTLDVFDGGRIKPVRIVNEGSQRLGTRLGQLDTVRVKTSNAESSRRVTYTWFAPELNNLPVRIEQHKDGKLIARLSVSEFTPK